MDQLVKINSYEGKREVNFSSIVSKRNFLHGLKSAVIIVENRLFPNIKQ